MYDGDDYRLMAENISSGFNYRQIAGTDKLSLHAYGLAFDINPVQNPYIHKLDNKIVVDPPGAKYDPAESGALANDHRLVQFLTKRGWVWGGSWTLEKTGRVDYQHFEKPLA